MTRRNRPARTAAAAKRRALARARERERERGHALPGGGAEEWAADAERFGRDWAARSGANVTGRPATGEVE